MSPTTNGNRSAATPTPWPPTPKQRASGCSVAGSTRTCHRCWSPETAPSPPAPTPSTSHPSARRRPRQRRRPQRLRRPRWAPLLHRLGPPHPRPTPPLPHVTHHTPSDQHRRRHMTTTVDKLVTQLHDEGDPAARDELASRYGIHTDDAVGIPMRRLKQIAKPLRPNHELAAERWATRLYEARTIAAHIDDPTRVTAEQMDSWAHDFDNWAIVDTTCFQLFDKAPDAWSMLEPWADNSVEFIKRAAFALLWALALHDADVPDENYRQALALIESNATDDRHVVQKAQTTALRAIAQKRPHEPMRNALLIGHITSAMLLIGPATFATSAFPRQAAAAANGDTLRSAPLESYTASAAATATPRSSWERSASRSHNKDHGGTKGLDLTRRLCHRIRNLDPPRHPHPGQHAQQGRGRRTNRPSHQGSAPQHHRPLLHCVVDRARPNDHQAGLTPPKLRRRARAHIEAARRYETHSRSTPLTRGNATPVGFNSVPEGRTQRATHATGVGGSSWRRDSRSSGRFRRARRSRTPQRLRPPGLRRRVCRRCGAGES